MKYKNLAGRLTSTIILYIVSRNFQRAILLALSFTGWISKAACAQMKNDEIVKKVIYLIWY